MSNTIPNSFENIKKYQDALFKRHNLFVKANNKLNNFLPNISILGSAIITETEYSAMSTVIDNFVDYPTQSFDNPRSTKGISVIYVNYDIILENATQQLVDSVETKIVIQSGVNGDGASTDFARLVYGREQNIINPKLYQWLSSNKILISVGFLFNNDRFYSDYIGSPWVFEPGTGALSPYYAKLILKFNNFGSFI